MAHSELLIWMAYHGAFGLIRRVLMIRKLKTKDDEINIKYSAFPSKFTLIYSTAVVIYNTVSQLDHEYESIEI